MAPAAPTERLLARQVGVQAHASLTRPDTASLPGALRRAADQVAGSSTSGYQNENEHLGFLIKISQMLGVLPALEITLYHVDNPYRQPWRDLLLFPPM